MRDNRWLDFRLILHSIGELLQQPTAVNDCHDKNATVLDTINHTIAVDETLSDACLTKFWNNTAQLWLLGNRFRCVDDSRCDRRGVPRRVSIRYSRRWFQRLPVPLATILSGEPFIEALLCLIMWDSTLDLSPICTFSYFFKDIKMVLDVLIGAVLRQGFQH